MGQPLRDLTSNQFITCSETGDECPSSHECVSIYLNGNNANRCCPTKSILDKKFYS